MAISQYLEPWLWAGYNSETTAESWLSQQLQYDLAKAETKRRSLRVKKLAAA